MHHAFPWSATLGKQEGGRKRGEPEKEVENAVLLSWLQLLINETHILAFEMFVGLLGLGAVSEGGHREENFSAWPWLHWPKLAGL